MMKKVFSPLLAYILFLCVFQPMAAQQNVTMYTVPENPQVNTLNPAFQNTCKLFIGLPVISSMHFNYGNDAFTYKQLFRKDGNGYFIEPSNISPGRIRSVSAEAYVALVNIGFWHKKKYITFSVHEKTDLAGFFNRDLFAVATGGNTLYEASEANFSRSGILFDYRREYALGVAQKINKNTTLGIKGKLLFGKLNMLTHAKNSDLSTNGNTFDLSLNSNVYTYASLPITMALDPYGKPTNIHSNANARDVLFNGKNLGLAVDLGFINKRSEKVTLSGSILDLGFIHYASTPYNYSIEGSYDYTGQMGDSAVVGYFFRRMVDTVFNNMNTELTQKSYLSFLAPRIYVSYAYQYSPKTTLNVVATGKIYRYKLNPGFSVSASHEFAKNMYVSLSWSYLYHSFKNIGTGVVLGKSPVQFYAFTDNLLGLIYPLNTRNINLRFGINLIFGCTKRANLKTCGCEGINNSVEKRNRLQKILKK
jgi:hypothetical protein